MGMSKVGNPIRPRGNASLRAFLFPAVSRTSPSTPTRPAVTGDGPPRPDRHRPPGPIRPSDPARGPSLSESGPFNRHIRAPLARLNEKRRRTPRGQAWTAAQVRRVLDRIRTVEPRM